MPLVPGRGRGDGAGDVKGGAAQGPCPYLKVLPARTAARAESPGDCLFGHAARRR